MNGVRGLGVGARDAWHFHGARHKEAFIVVEAIERQELDRPELERRFTGRSMALDRGSATAAGRKHQAAQNGGLQRCGVELPHESERC